MKLHPVLGRHVQRKHLRVDLGGFHAFVPHQALQRLQRNARVEHVHGVAVAESMRRYRHGERDSVTCGCVDGLVQLGAHRPVGYRPKPDLLDPACVRVAPLKRNFQRGDHHLQLGHVLRIGQRHQPVRDHA